MSPATAGELLGPEGPLAREMGGYEHRPGQLAMARAVERALLEDRILLCEAGTGTGKTLAYLVAALTSGLTVVVSTASRALQEQIVHKDLPLIQRHLGITARAQMVKGLGNYLCLRRLEELRRSAGLSGDRGPLARALVEIDAWSQATETGDIAELTALPESHAVWPHVTSSSETRVGTRCPHFEACHVTRLKRARAEARLLVVNHHLFFADLALRGDHPGAVLPPYDAVIFDEAHKLEDIASIFFGSRLSTSGAARLLSDAERTFSLVRAGAPTTLLSRAHAELEALFAAVNLAATHGAEERVALDPSLWRGELLERYHALDDSLFTLARLAAEEAEETMANLATRIDRQREALAAIVEPSARAVTWLERHRHGLSLVASPVSVGPILRDKLLARGAAVVLTSASLRTGGGFAFIRGRLGLDETVAAPVDELAVAEALDHGSQALLYAPTDLPDVGAAEFADAAAERIVRLWGMSHGGAFVLCTSRDAMRRLAAALAARSDRAPLVQGDAPKAALLSRFREAGDALLVATMSFWEGVDVPGSALSLVVLARLPFSVPSDPLVRARCEAIEAEGGSAFFDYMLPRAAILLKQGFGRLLRTRRDHGVVAVLDRRIRTKGYGDRLLDSLPEVRLTGELEDVERFWEVKWEELDTWLTEPGS